MKRIYGRLLLSTGLIEDPSKRSLVSRIMATSTWSLLGVVALGSIGVDTSPVLTTLGVTGATVGFACKDLGANFAAGTALAFQRPFKTGRIITVGTVKGTVDHWDMRYLYLKGSKGELICVPNATVFTNIIIIDSVSKEELKEIKDEVPDESETPAELRNYPKPGTEEDDPKKAKDVAEKLKKWGKEGREVLAKMQNAPAAAAATAAATAGDKHEDATPTSGAVGHDDGADQAPPADAEKK